MGKNQNQAAQANSQPQPQPQPADAEKAKEAALAKWNALSSREKHEIYQPCRAEALRRLAEENRARYEALILICRKEAHAGLGLPDPEELERSASKKQGGFAAMKAGKYAWKPAKSA